MIPNNFILFDSSFAGQIRENSAFDVGARTNCVRIVGGRLIQWRADGQPSVRGHLFDRQHRPTDGAALRRPRHDPHDVDLQNGSRQFGYSVSDLDGRSSGLQFIAVRFYVP